MALRLIGTIRIEGRTESANAIDKMHWRKRVAYTKKWRDDARLSALCSTPADKRIPAGAKDWTQFCGPRRVVFTGHRHRLCDRQNFARGCKPLLDGLVDAGVLVDDSIAWVSDFYEQVQVKKGQPEYLEIQVFEEAAND